MASDTVPATPPARPAVIQSKLTPPPLPERFAERPRLEKHVARLMSEKRAVVVSAAAGSGKTTAVAGAALRLRRPVAWLTVDRSDSAPGRLVTYLEAALARVRPATDGVATAAVAAGIPHAEAAGLLAEAAGPDPVVMVIDELERLNVETEAWRVVESLQRYLPLGSCLVLISRHDVPTSLCALPAPPALGVVADADVAFTAPEAKAALARLGQKGTDAEELVASTAGWVTGVLFEGWRATEQLEAQGGETDPLYEYLASQMLADLGEPAQELLIATSLLDEVDARRAEALGITGSAEILGELRSVHLPVAWADDGRVLRVHSFFREYLHTCLLRRGEEPLRALRRAHGRLLVQEGHDEDAVETFLAAGAPDEAVAPAERAILGVVERMDLAVADRWIEALAGQERSAASPLVTAELLVAIARDEVARVVEMADALAERDERETVAASSERAALLMGWCYLHHARYDDVDALLEVCPGPGADTLRYAMGALTDRPPVERPERPSGGPVDAMRCIADYCHGRLSDLAEPSGSRWIEAVERPWRIAALRARGRTKDALEQYEAAPGGAFANSTMVMLSAPELLMDAGRWEEAEQMVREARRLAVDKGSVAFAGLSHVHEAKLRLRHRRDAAGALAALEHPECLLAREGFRFIGELAEAWGGLALLLEGRDEEARTQLRGAVASMSAADRMLELPAAAVFLAEAEWRLGAEAEADQAARLAMEAADRQGSNHILLQALAFFPVVVSRGVEAAEADSPWHALGRALLAQGVAVGVLVTSRVELREFGGRTILVDGEEVKPRIAKSYELLAYLLAERSGGCERDELLDVLFDGRRDESKRAYLRQAIRWLRGSLPEGAFVAEGSTVALAGDVTVTSESVELEARLGEAARLQGGERLDATLQALAVYDRGPYLPGPRGGWADEREHQLAEIVAAARYHAAVLAFAEGRYDECRMLVEAVLQHDRYREAAWRLLMRVAQAMGDEDAATRAFQGCEQALEEIGVAPSPSTRLLVDRARR